MNELSSAALREGFAAAWIAIRRYDKKQVVGQIGRKK
jgi:hypothetical protein